MIRRATFACNHSLDKNNHPNVNRLYVFHSPFTLPDPALTATDQPTPEWLPDLIQLAPVGVLVLAAARDEAGAVVDFEVRWFNPKAQQIGTANSPLYQVGSRLLAVLPNLRESHFDRLLTLLQTGESFTEDNLADNHRYYRSTFVRFNDGIVIYYNENSALTTANSLERLLDSAPAAIMFFKAVRENGPIADFEWVMVNRRAVEITGLPTEQLVGHRLLVVHPHNRELGLFEAYVEVVEANTPYHAEVNYTQDGVNGWFSITAVRHDDGMLMHILDITNRKASELAVEQQSRQLQQVNRELRQMNENLQQFAYSSSHDLQEPLRKIQTLAELLRTNFAGTLGDSADLVNRMHSAAERMSVLVRDLLMFSRLGTLSQDFKPVNLSQTMAEVVRLRQRQVDRCQAIITVEALPTVRGDKVQLVQLFDCLLSNALKYQPAGQAPVLTVGAHWLTPSEAANVDGLHAHQPYWCLTFTDNGIGFDARYTERIFQMFQRLHARHSPYGGTGVGLAVARRIVENHGGFIQAHPRPDSSGSVFTVYLPGGEVSQAE